MLKIAAVCLICITLISSIIIGIYALFRSQSNKKNYFLLIQIMVIVYLFGYLMEITSTNAEEAFTAVKVLYVGAHFTPLFTFFFVTDYCNIKLHPVYIKTPMIFLTMTAILAMWTSKYHSFMYLGYEFDPSNMQGLAITPGPFYSVIHTYPMACLILTMIILLYKQKKWANKYRKQLLTLFVCLVIPFAAEGFYYLMLVTKIFNYYLYLTPYSMAIMSFCLYIGVMRFSIFEIIPVATLAAMEHIKEGFVLVDKDNNYLSSNLAALMVFPGIKKLVKGESISSAGDWPKEFKEMDADMVEFSITNKNIKYFEASISPVIAKNQTVEAKIIILRDITEHTTLMKKLETAAFLDSLTGLYSRKHFSELAYADIERANRSNQSIYTAMLDLDFFKNINDSYGHAAGDIVLKKTAEIIHQTIRSYDLLGRYGGEEFVLLITDLDLTEARKLMERIRENMEQSSIYYDGNELKITCSIGLAQFTENDTLETSIKKADEALYKAKNSGRNQVQIAEPPLHISRI